MTLVVGYGAGETSRTALKQAISLATSLGEPLLIVCGVSPAGGLGEEYGAVEDALVEAFEPLVAEAVATARAAGVEADSMLVDAAPADAILTAAVERGCRMVIVGYGSAGRIRAALFGAVAHRVLDESDIPVLVVP